MSTTRARRDPRAIAIGAILLSAAALAVIAAAAPELGDGLGREAGLLETLQWLMTLAAAALAAATIPPLRRASQPIAFEVTLIAGLVAIVIGEVDLDKLLVGRKIIYTRFFVDDSVPLGWRIAAAVALGGSYLAIAAYVIASRRVIWRDGLAALGEPWGQTLGAGVAIFALTEIFEKPLGRVPGLPRNYAEESMEFFSAICFVVALLARRDARSVRGGR